MTDIPPPGKTHQEFGPYLWPVVSPLTVIEGVGVIVPPVAAVAHRDAGAVATGYVVRDTITREVVVTRAQMCGARFTRRWPLAMATLAASQLNEAESPNADYRVET